MPLEDQPKAPSRFYRDELAAKLKQTLDKEERKRLLNEAKDSKEYQEAEFIHFIDKIEEVIRHPDSLTEQDKEAYIKKLKKLFLDRERYSKLSTSELVLSLLEKERMGSLGILYQEGSLKNLNYDVANYFIENGKFAIIVQEPEIFDPADYPKIIDKLILDRNPIIALKLISLAKDINIEEIKQKLADTKQDYIVLNDLELFRIPRDQIVEYFSRALDSIDNFDARRIIETKTSLITNIEDKIRVLEILLDKSQDQNFNWRIFSKLGIEEIPPQLIKKLLATTTPDLFFDAVYKNLIDLNLNTVIDLIEYERFEILDRVYSQYFLWQVEGLQISEETLKKLINTEKGEHFLIQHLQTTKIGANLPQEIILNLAERHWDTISKSFQNFKNLDRAVLYNKLTEISNKNNRQFGFHTFEDLDKLNFLLNLENNLNLSEEQLEELNNILLLNQDLHWEDKIDYSRSLLLSDKIPNINRENILLDTLNYLNLQDFYYLRFDEYVFNNDIDLGDYTSELIKILPDIKGVDLGLTLDKMMYKYSSLVLEQLELFTPEQRNLIFSNHKAIIISDENNLKILLSKIELFGDSKDELIELIVKYYMDKDRYDVLLSNSEILKINHDEMITKLLELDKIATIDEIFYLFVSLKKVTHSKIAQEIITKYGAEEFVKLKIFRLDGGLTKLSNSIFNSLDEGGVSKDFLWQHIPKFSKLSPEKFNFYYQDSKYNKSLLFSYLTNFDIDKIELIDPAENKAFNFCMQIFRDYSSYDNFDACLKIIRQQLSPEEMKQLGVTTQGEGGLNQLREIFKAFRKEFFEQNLSILDTVTQSDFLTNYFMRLVRFDIQKWGGRLDKTKEGLLKQLELLKSKTQYFTLNPDYFESGEKRIRSTSLELPEDFNFSEEFLTKYTSLSETFNKSIELINMEESQVLEKLLAEFEVIKKQIVESLREKLENISNERAIESINSRIQLLENFKFPPKGEESLSEYFLNNFESSFLKLGTEKEFYPLLNEIIYYVSFKNNPSYIETISRIIKSSHPSIDQIDEILDFDDKTQNTWAQIWATIPPKKQLADQIRKITSSKAIVDEKLRIDKFKKITGTKPMEFIPTRGVLFEFSGSIADACWSGKYESVAEHFPNITCITMVLNKGTVNERLAGSCLLIEAEDASGEPILIVRGLNPLENVINELDAKDFFETFTSYIKDLSLKLGRKPAIVIDNCTRAATNREAIWKQLELYKQTNPTQITLGTSFETTFNDLPIENYTYELE